MTAALDKSCNRDSHIFRRDLQKLRHGVLPAGTIFPAAETKSIGLLAIAQLSWFLHRHLESVIATGQLAAIYRDSVIWTTLS